MNASSEGSRGSRRLPGLGDSRDRESRLRDSRSADKHSRPHGLELMTLARSTKLLYRAAGRTRTIWPAGVEPAVSGAQSRRGGLLPYSQSKPPAGVEPALPD